MSSALSRQIHSINIGEKLTDGSGRWKDSTLKNTWDTYHLVPSSRPVVNPPDVKTNYVDIPGIDGPLDLTESLTGIPMYENRKGSWDFVVANDYEPWTTIYHKLMNDLHGRKWLVSLQDEPMYYYKGRLSVNEWKSERNWSKITLDYNFEPYKYELNSGNEPWLWDPFNFETGVIRNYGSKEAFVSDGQTLIHPFTVNGADSITIYVQPTERPNATIVWVESGNDITVKLGGGSTQYPLQQGKNNLTATLASGLSDPSFGYIHRQGRTFTFSGHGTVWVEFQGGWL